MWKHWCRRHKEQELKWKQSMTQKHRVKEEDTKSFDEQREMFSQSQVLKDISKTPVTVFLLPDHRRCLRHTDGCCETAADYEAKIIIFLNRNISVYFCPSLSHTNPFSHSVSTPSVSHGWCLRARSILEVSAADKKAGRTLWKKGKFGHGNVVPPRLLMVFVTHFSGDRKNMNMKHKRGKLESCRIKDNTYV